MIDQSQLPYLVNLIDDETDEVRKEILKVLSSYGTSLERDLQEYSIILDKDKKSILQPILEANRREWLTQNWDSWFYIHDEIKKLEMASDLIAKFQYGITDHLSAAKIIDNLAEEFRLKAPYGDEIDLANFLFQEKGIIGAHQDYDNPLNSNLLYALTENKGLPITLCLIYILTGARLGMNIEGCNFPGHFLSKTYIDNETVLVDCFNGGKIIYREDLIEMAEDSYPAVLEIVDATISAGVIIRRILNNIVNAYKTVGNQANADFFTVLLNRTPVN